MLSLSKIPVQKLKQRYSFVWFTLLCITQANYQTYKLVMKLLLFKNKHISRKIFSNAGTLILLSNAESLVYRIPCLRAAHSSELMNNNIIQQVNKTELGRLLPYHHKKVHVQNCEMYVSSKCCELSCDEEHSAFSALRRYISSVQKYKIAEYRDQNEYSEVLKFIEKHGGKYFSATLDQCTLVLGNGLCCMSHGDLHPGNLMRYKEKLALIDLDKFGNLRPIFYDLLHLKLSSMDGLWFDRLIELSDHRKSQRLLMRNYFYFCIRSYLENKYCDASSVWWASFRLTLVEFEKNFIHTLHEDNTR